MLRASLFFGGGFLLGVAVMARLKPAVDSSCCRRVAAAARGQITGTLGGWAGSFLDGLGVTDQLPAIIDGAGVPYGDE